MTRHADQTPAGRRLDAPAADQNYEHRDEYGNIEANLRFLETAGTLTPDLHVLEIGCGKGTLLTRLLARGHHIVGCEISDDLIAQSRMLHGPLPIHKISDVALPYPDRSFDVVLSFDVLEHIGDTDHHLREVARVLRPGGCYMLQTPNKWTNTIFETIRWRSFTTWRPYHCSLHSYRQIERRLSDHGFDVEFYDIPVVNAFFRRKVYHYLGRPGLMVLAAINPDRLPLPLRTNLYVKASLRPAARSAAVAAADRPA